MTEATKLVSIMCPDQALRRAAHHAGRVCPAADPRRTGLVRRRVFAFPVGTGSARHRLEFCFHRGTVLLPHTCQPAEWLKVQAVNEFAVLGLAALLRGGVAMPDGHNQGRVQIG